MISGLEVATTSDGESKPMDCPGKPCQLDEAEVARRREVCRSNAAVTMMTHGGRLVDLFDPDPKSIALDDIAWSLAHQNRFCGHVGVYTVAEHSIRAARLALDRGADAFAVLMHDAHEAYLGDITRPVKQVIESAAPGLLKRIEIGLDRAIATALGFDVDRLWHPAVKTFDETMLAIEERDLRMPKAWRRDVPEWSWREDIGKGWLPPDAYEEFCYWFHRLKERTA